jgi:outer membrane protein
MKKLIRIGVCTIAFLGAISNMYAQKIAYLNSAVLLSQMDEVKQADTQLETYQKQLQKQFQMKVETFQKKYEEVAKKEKAGLLTKAQLEAESKKMQEDQQKLGAEEQELAKLVQEKREKELQPILEKVNKIIADVAKEKGYNYVMDSSTPVLLYADETLDLAEAVKSKLGIVSTPKPEVKKN